MVKKRFVKRVEWDFGDSRINKNLMVFFNVVILSCFYIFKFGSSWSIGGRMVIAMASILYITLCCYYLPIGKETYYEEV